MNDFSEDNLIEKTAIRIFGELWGSDNFINAYTEKGDALLGRENQGEVVLKKYLRPALERLNPEAPSEAIEEGVNALVKDRSMQSMVNANHKIWKLLRNGIKVDITNEKQELETITLRVFDFEKAENNDFLLVSQFWVTGDLHKRRPDLVGFVNGIPLVLIELKASHKNLRDAYDQNIKDYKDTIPQIFWYNAIIIISNGVEARVGTVTSGYEHFGNWKKSESEEEEGRVEMKVALEGTCKKEKLLDILENFTLFDGSAGEVKKIIAKYFQLLGVNKAFERIKNREGGSTKQLGVFWHTQGSGKSYSMIFLSQKVMRKITGNFTFVVLTDRKELDKQIYNRFATCEAVQKEEVHAQSVSHLRELLQEDHRFIFTLIHKFQANGNEKPPLLSDREDIIVMADEAHRTQYDRLAQNMRIALPNASFIGFTGTPLIAEEEKTRETFGDYISTYNFSESIEDKSTVPLFYENRVPKLENVNPNMERDLEKILEFHDLDEEEEEKIEREFSTFYSIIKRDDRLDKIAEDIVLHFVNRGFQGKAMMVSIDKATAIRTYKKVEEKMERYLGKLRNDFLREENEKKKEDIKRKIKLIENLDMAAIVSPDQNEIAKMEEHGIDIRPIRERTQNEDLETKFKNPESNLRLVFVCAMWITGFDVLNLSTLYLDKPLKNHTLMQTITRANRVFPGKTHGLIVDYIGVFRSLQKALALYAVPEKGGISPGDIIKEKSELVDKLKGIIEELESHLEDINLTISDLIEAENIEKIKLIDRFTNKIIEDEETKKKYLDLSSRAYNYYKAILPDPEAESYYSKVFAFKVVASRIREAVSKRIDVSYVKKDLENLLDESIKAGEYVIEKTPKITDLTKFDFDALKDFFLDTENKNIAASELSEDLKEKVEQMVKKNKMRQQFLDRLNKLLDDYNTGTKDVDEFFDELINFAKDLSKEEQRTIEENLSEEELAIFDLILKDNLNPDEEEKVKKVAKELLEKLKEEKLVLDWRKKEQTRAGVKVFIRDMLFDYLPESYDESDCEKLMQKVYFHIYDSYIEANKNVYIE
jgi:type I restriction enzyme R subunit